MDQQMWWQVLVGVVGGLVVLWLILLVLLWRTQRHQPDKTTFRQAVRLIPDVVRLLRRLAGDPTLPRGVRIRLWLLLAYLLMPIDLVPDLIPVLGYADDAIIVVLAIRSVARSAGTTTLRRHWPGTPEGLNSVLTLSGLPSV